MRLRSRRGAAGFKFERFSSSTALAPALDPHEMADLPEHTGEGRGLLVLARAADLAEAERPQRAAVRARLADGATRLRDLQLRHSVPPKVAGPSRGNLPVPP